MLGLGEGKDGTHRAEYPTLHPHPFCPLGQNQMRTSKGSKGVQPSCGHACQG